MQPAYLPWIGYFDLIDQSDHFIILDNVQFAKEVGSNETELLLLKDLSG